MLNTLDFVLLLLAAAVVVVTLFRSLNLPPVLGYLLVGAIGGPHALDLMHESKGASHLAEFGIVFLMFSIGLEFSLPRLFAMKRIVFGLGAAQVVVGIVVATVLGGLLDLGWVASFALGGTLVMSSTAILSKLLTDRLELDSPHGRETIGVLLFQDLAVVPLLIMLPALSRPPEELFLTLALALVKVVVLLALVLVFGPRLMRWWFTFVARRRSSELFMLNVLFITLGLAWLSEYVGLSLALGAFLAGMLISETDYRYQVEEDIKPFRDVLLGLFFVTVGMFLDVMVIIRNLHEVLGLLALLLGLKFVIVFIASRAFGSPPGTAMRSGLWLCAGGEFGFVLLSEAVESGLLPRGGLGQATVAAVVLSMLLAPLIVQMSDKLVMRFVSSEWLMRSMELTRVAAQSLNTDKHLIICGYGRSGQYMARFLEREKVSYMALDLDPDRVRDARAAGDSVVYGDAARHETLMAAGIMRASALVISFAGVEAALRVMHHAHALRPGLPIVVRAGDESEMEKLSIGGASEVVPEVFEGSIMLASHALALVGVPLQRVVRHIRDIRNQRYALMRGFFHGASDIGEAESALLRLRSITLPAGASALGRTIGELTFDNINVDVSALRRSGVRSMAPTAETRIQEGDVLVLRGTPADLEAAESRLLTGE